MNDRRQKNQLQRVLAFTEEGRRGKGPNRSRRTAKPKVQLEQSH
jgi:hypothetical protein